MQLKTFLLVDWCPLFFFAAPQCAIFTNNSWNLLMLRTSSLRLLHL